MSERITRLLIALSALLTLSVVNASIFYKEQTIREGRTVFLELAPADPRSLMQGDYMALRFQLAERIETARKSSPAWADLRRAPLQIDARGVAQLSTTPTNNAVHIRYALRDGQIWLGTNAYFFAEGTAQRYADARYGEFKLNPDSGEAVLVGLRDSELRPL